MRWTFKGQSLYRGSAGHRHNADPSKRKNKLSSLPNALPITRASLQTSLFHVQITCFPDSDLSKIVAAGTMTGIQPQAMKALVYGSKSQTTHTNSLCKTISLIKFQHS